MSTPTNGTPADGWDRFARLSVAEFDRALNDVMVEMGNLLGRKRESYGPSNLSKFGDVGVLVRTSDKVERLAHMHRHGLTTSAVGEDAEDAWRDIAGYALLALVAHALNEGGAR